MSNQPDRFVTWTRPEIMDGVPTEYGWVVRHPQMLSLGLYTDIGYSTFIQAQYGITIGDYAQIGAHCSLYTISTIDGKAGRIHIGKWACIGAGSVVMPGVTVGDGAIVGALSFVNRSIPAGQVWGGNPIHYLKDTEEVGNAK